VGWRAQTHVHPVELKSGRSAAAETEITENFVLNPRKNPGRSRIVGIRSAAIVRTVKIAL
jgi:hypothetical protein